MVLLVPASPNWVAQAARRHCPTGRYGARGRRVKDKREARSIFVPLQDAAGLLHVAVDSSWGASRDRRSIPAAVIGAMVSALVMVGGVSLVNRTTRLSDDTGIGLLFVGMLALGVIILSREATFAGDLTGLLFGDVLGVRNDEIRLGAIVLAITIVGLVAGHRSFLALAVNRDKAETLGLHPKLAHAVLLTLLALSVVSSFRVVGTLLVFGFLVAPPATAVLIVRRIPVAMVIAVLFGWLSVLIGLVISYHHDTAASATIAGVAVAQFFVVLTVTEIRDFMLRRSPRPSH